MIHREYFGYTIQCGDVNEASELRKTLSTLGSLKTRVIALGQYVQVILDEHEKFDDSREAWEMFIKQGLDG